MNKLKINLLLFFAFAILLVGAVDATTLVAGKIYNADFTETIGGASVLVNCTHNGVSTLRETTSLEDGTYAVSYPETGEGACNNGDLVRVDARKGNLYGSSSGIVNDDVIGTWDIAIVNVPLVPEFGVIVGLITLVSAVGIFFAVRKN